MNVMEGRCPSEMRGSDEASAGGRHETQFDHNYDNLPPGRQARGLGVLFGVDDQISARDVHRAVRNRGKHRALCCHADEHFDLEYQRHIERHGDAE